MHAGRPRGSVATVLNEIAAASDVGIAIEEERIPLREEVIGACEILGRWHTICSAQFHSDREVD